MCSSPYFTTKAPGAGTGLGLAVVYGIVKEHDGWIKVASIPGQGTVFRIHIPAVESQGKRPERKSINPDLYHGSGETILVVEDQQEVLTVCSSALKNYGYRVVEALSVKAALDLFVKCHNRIDLVLSDVVLPDDTGLALAEKLRAVRPDLKIILSSGYTDEKSQWPIVQEKNYPFLPKPYSLHDLLQTVHAVLNTP